ncbi:MAG: hypothetical protein AAF985_11120 [Bacteroidota bacterium]
MKVFLSLLTYCLAAYLLVLLPEKTFLFLTEEDSWFEWMGAICFLLTALLYVAAFLWRDRNWFFLLLAFLFFFSFGEEISWGQRLLDIPTPERLQEINIQKEINLHNLRIFNLDKYDTEHTWGQYFTSKNLFIGFFFTYLIIIPLAQFFPSIRKIMDSINLPVPPWNIGLAFVANMLILKLFRLVDYGNRDINSGLLEIEESNIALILLMLPLGLLKRERST